MNYIILAIIVLTLSAFYERARYNATKTERIIFFLLICVVLCGFAGLRSSYNDTKTYIAIYQSTSDSISNLFTGKFAIGTAYLNQLYVWFLHRFISQDYHVYFFISSAMFIIPAVYAIDKYSERFTFSMFLFMTSGLYLFSLAAVRQSIAMGILVWAIDAFAEEKYKRFVILVLLATSFHLYSLLLIILIFMRKDKIFDFRMNAVCFAVLLVGVGMTQFSIYFSDLATVIGKDISAEEISTGSVSILRAAVYAVPMVLAFVSRAFVNYERDEYQNVFIMLSVLSGVFMLLARFGNPILFGRLPYYFVIGTVISLPYVISRGLNKSSAKLVSFLAIVFYCAYEIHELRMDEAFTRDIFKLMWFQ